jgi:SAM-dependent methyltransferase
MTSSEVWDEETAERYDADSADRFAPEVLDPAVDFLARLAGSGAALEFAIGTGRVAIPLAARGVPVTGIELSAPMVAQLRRKADGATVPVRAGDMATTTVPGEFSLVYLVWNSISNLRTQQEQVECFRNAARHLSAGGRFVIELWVPPLRRLPPGQLAAPMNVSDGHLVFDTHDLATQQCASHHYWREAGGSTRYDSGNFRYIWPAECDLMAQLAGMELEERVADWTAPRLPPAARATSPSGASRSCWVLPPLRTPPSECLVTGWRGVLAQGHRPRLQIRMLQELAHERGGSADTGPVIVPERRYQPGAIGGEHHVGQDAFPERPETGLAPGGSLLRPRLHQHVMPAEIQRHHRGAGEEDVIGTSVEVPQPPRLAR